MKIINVCINNGITYGDQSLLKDEVVDMTNYSVESIDDQINGFIADDSDENWAVSDAVFEYINNKYGIN